MEFITTEERLVAQKESTLTIPCSSLTHAVTSN
jgi:hypothetical protein